MSEKLDVVEIFHSIEGEGLRTGEWSIFIRLFGCNLNCSFCDSRYAWMVPEGEGCKAPTEGLYTEMSINEIINEIDKYKCHNVTITGGEPLCHAQTKSLVRELQKCGYQVNIETNGSIDLAEYIALRGNWGYCDDLILTCDFKCTYSGMTDKMNVNNFDLLSDNDVLKFVVADERDLQQAYLLTKQYDLRCWIYLSPVFGKIELKEIVEFMRVHRFPLKTRLQVQLHKVIWPADMRGV